MNGSKLDQTFLQSKIWRLIARMSPGRVQIDHLDLASLEFVDLLIMTFKCNNNMSTRECDVTNLSIVTY